MACVICDDTGGLLGIAAGEIGLARDARFAEGGGMALPKRELSPAIDEEAELGCSCDIASKGLGMAPVRAALSRGGLRTIFCVPQRGHWARMPRSVMSASSIIKAVLHLSHSMRMRKSSLLGEQKQAARWFWPQEDTTEHEES